MIMVRDLLILLVLLPLSARAQPILDSVSGHWTVGSTTECARSTFEWSYRLTDGGASIAFRDRAGRVNSERVDALQQDGFTTTTVSSPDVRAGTRWDYRRINTETFVVRNLLNGRQFTLIWCSPTFPPSVTAPTFTDPAALITWLVTHSSRDFTFGDDRANANVFSPELRQALRQSFLHARQNDGPPCGADGDIILDTQDTGPVRNLRVSLQSTAPNHVTVAASFDVNGNHRNVRYMTVDRDGAWQVDEIIESDGASVRGGLGCGR